MVFFNQDLAGDYRYHRKQATQLASKMRFFAVQFTALLEGALWRENALQANRMAAILADAVCEIPGMEITQPVESNAVFAAVPKEVIPSLMKHTYFYLSKHDTTTSVVRWMTSWKTTDENVHAFATALTESMNRTGKKE